MRNIIIFILGTSLSAFTFIKVVQLLGSGSSLEVFESTFYIWFVIVSVFLILLFKISSNSVLKLCFFTFLVSGFFILAGVNNISEHLLRANLILLILGLSLEIRNIAMYD